MPSAFAQTMPPTEHFSQSRLTATIVALIALAFVLAAVFIYLQSGQRTQPPVADQRVQAINQMLAELRGATPVAQADMQAMSKQVSASKVQVTQSQIDQIKDQLKGQ